MRLLGLSLACLGLGMAVPCQEKAKPPRYEVDPAVPSVLPWESNAARALASGRPVFAFMTRPNCPNSTWFCQKILAQPGIREWVAAGFQPLILSIDVINMEDLKRRAGRPKLSGAEAKDNEFRFNLKKRICGEVTRKSPIAAPPLMAILAPNGEAVAAAAEQVIDTEGRGGGQKGFGKIPGRPGPVPKGGGGKLKLDDAAILQTRNWSNASEADAAKKAWLFVSLGARNAVAVYDLAPFLKGASKDIPILGVSGDVPNPKKLLVDGETLWVGNNPGSSVTRVSVAGLPQVKAGKQEVIPVGKDPMYMALGWEFAVSGTLFVCCRGADCVSVVRGGREIGRLDASNSAPLREPYGIWISGDSTRMIVSNFADEHATWWNFRLFPDGPFKDPRDLLISSDRIWTGAGVTAIDGDYGP